jgi:hypothetical protein
MSGRFGAPLWRHSLPLITRTIGLGGGRLEIDRVGSG